MTNFDVTKRPKELRPEELALRPRCARPPSTPGDETENPNEYWLADRARSDLTSLGLMEAFTDASAGPSKRVLDPNAVDIFAGENSGFGVVQLPADLFDADVRHLAYRIVRSVYHMEPPKNPLMSAVYRMLAKLADQGVQANMEAVTIGLLLGAARVHGLKISTHPRHLAKEVKCRYGVLLKIRKAAHIELSRLSPAQLGGGNLL